MELLGLVDALTIADDAPALLVQCEKDWAAVAVKPNGVLLVVLDACGDAPWVTLAARASAVLRTEQREVLEGLCGGVMAVALLGAKRTPEDLEEAPPRIEALGREVRWLLVGPAGAVADKRKLRSPSAAAIGGVEAALVKALASPAGAPVPSARRRIAESAGESALVAEGAFRAATTKSHPPATVALLAACVAVFLLEMFWGASGSTPGLLRMGAVSGRRVVAGHYEALLASALLHAGVIHIAMNGAALASLGRVLERTIGAWRFVLVFSASALGGSIALVLLKPQVVAVGASGGIFGLMTALLGLTLRRRGELPDLARQRLRQALVSALAFNFALSLLPGISLLAHAGGGVVGFVLGVSGLASAGAEVPWLPRPHSGAADRTGARYRAAGVTCVALLAISLVVALAKGKPWDFNPSSLRMWNIAGTRWTIQVPENLAVRETSGPDDARAQTFGRTDEDPLVVTVHTTRSPNDDPQFDAEDLVAARAKAHAASFHVPGNPEIYRKTAVIAKLSGTTKEGARYTGWFFWTDGRLVEIDAVLEPRAPAAWRAALDRTSPIPPEP